ncbi:unnamed protein product [Cylicocyclus nassatus]|uniref:Carboxylesterase type B domain-containing protein n=1 Tax=Cylicocyclus nassatus TaxID=53992 RepID=A0AA36GHZ3_CYLNA|nr:unnamed protein product [Cylicocyclus nassatus]
MIIHCFLISLVLLQTSAQVLDLIPGKVHGFDYRMKNDDLAEVFLKIPYAAPPVGELRFEKPRPVIPWRDMVRDGTSFGPGCHQILPDVGFKKVPTSEDCLTLNIIRPKKEPPPTGFPVMFWIHGGGYQFGSAHDYGYKGFADIYIPNYIIVVTIQYRLGVYGFFSSGDERISGNLGLFDMAEALKFVHSNAKYIGADPSRITVWGHSAGSSAAGQLILSPVTRDYLPRSIEMSGSPWTSWALGGNVVNNSLQLAEKLVEQVYSGNHLQQIMDEIIAYYVDRKEEKSYDFYIDRYTEFISDLLFNVPAVEGILARLEAGWDLYVYLLDHYNDAIWDRNVTKKMRGAPHASETPYTNDVFFQKHFEFDDKERVVAEIFRQSFTEFVKTGAPSNRHEAWTEVGPGPEIRYLKIAPNPQLKQGFYNETTTFWRKIRRYGFDMVQLLPIKKPLAETREEL